MTEALDRAVKDNKNKPKLALFPMRALQWAGKAFTFGASKYAPYNWAKGLPHSELMDATLRHLTDYWGGEDNDPESGLPHLAHALCCVAMLLESKVRGIGVDDRWEWNPAQKLAAQIVEESKSAPGQPKPTQATSLARPRCKVATCTRAALKVDKYYGPFCNNHEVQNAVQWNVCEEPNCVRWVNLAEVRGFRQCSKHAKDHRKSRDFLGGQHP